MRTFIRRWRGIMLALVSVAVLGHAQLRVHRAARDAELAWALVDSSKVSLASTTMDREHFRELAAKATLLGGKPVAGTRIVIPRWDTVFVHDTLPTTLLPDSTRVATFTDSSAYLLIRATVTAPPCCGALRAKVEVTVPADTPTVGFVQVGDRTVATVLWRGREVRALAPFYAPPKLPRWGSFIEVLGDPTTVTVRGGTLLRLTQQLDAQAVVDQRFARDDKTRFLAGLRYRF